MFKQFIFYRYWRHLFGLRCAALLAIVLAGCEAKPAQPVSSTPPNEVKKKPFCEVAAIELSFKRSPKKQALFFQYEDGGSAKLFTMPETIGGGVAVWDFDLDGNLDLAFAGGGTFGPQERQITGRPLALFRNSGGLQFQEVTSGSHADQASGYSHGTIVGDYNADGFPDLLITGFGGLQLWKNLGDGTFENATSQAGLTDTLLDLSGSTTDRL
ncbi:MAG: VCBS repeat-containing protein [Pirellulales bacterium]